MNPGRDHTSVHLQGKQRQIALLTASWFQGSERFARNG